jgi:adenine-specific DNA methylase
VGLRPTADQLHLFEPYTLVREPPSTRYQGSKLKLLPWIWDNIADLPFSTALDAFGGTGSVSYLLKTHGKAVTYNDYLQFNCLVGKAIIENSAVRLSDQDLEFLLHRDPAFHYDQFIARTFHDVYFTDEEDQWLDTVSQNIPRLENPHKRALAYYSLFQSCIIKRPYNLFHRKNLYMRSADVERRFGNKATWDRPFEDHFRSFVAQANRAVFDSGVPCRALCYDALSVPGSYDLVYIDTPYINRRGVGVDYLAFYHFLEGLTDYPHWSKRVDYGKKHRPLKGQKSPWSDRRRCVSAFGELFRRYSNAILAVSYRTDGIPPERELIRLLEAVKGTVRTAHFGDYKYVLSTNDDSQETLLIAR